MDGDESALHALQTVDAVTEEQEIMNVHDCIMNGQKNCPIMGAVYDTLVGAYLLTQPDYIVSDDDFCDCICWITAVDGLPTLWSRLQKYKIPNRSGAALFSAMLPPDFCYRKGKVWIEQGILRQGQIEKGHIGVAQNSIIQYLWKEYGKERTGTFLTDIQFVINRWLVTYGFSVGLKDCLSESIEEKKMVQSEFEKGQLLVSGLGTKPTTDLLEAEQYEKDIRGNVDMIRNVGSIIATKNLDAQNALLIMAKSGAKGAEFNIAQIRGLLGQQFIKGKRLEPILSGGKRCLPCFEMDSQRLEAQGFIVHSFMEGLRPSELFFHQQAGREGLTDTAIRTSQSGYFHHKIIKALEDIKICYDGTVRNSAGHIIQYCYGEDGFDASELQMINDVPTFIDIKTTVSKLNSMYES